MGTRRRQLTLFADPREAAEIEAVRAAFDPVQSALIACHVTLCRDAEMARFESGLGDLRERVLRAVTVDLGPVVRFSEGRGVLLPAREESPTFHALRHAVLAPWSTDIRTATPHVTLLHPRNVACTAAIFAQIQNARLPGSLSFDTLSLIEQTDGKPWSLLESLALAR